jgi:hypothetical protein
VEDLVVRDLGELLSFGQTLSHDFVVNAFRRPLRILDAIAEVPCCSSILAFPPFIPEGSTGQVRVQYRPGRKSGRHRVDFHLHTDDPERPEILLRLLCTLAPDLEIQPSPGRTSAPSIPRNRSSSRRFSIICRRQGDQGRGTPSGILVTPPLSLDIHGTFVLEDPAAATSRSVTEVEVLFPPNSSDGAHRAALVLTWPDGSMHEQAVDWFVTPLIRATPPGLTLDGSRGSAPISRTVALQCDDRSFRVLSVDCPILALPVGPSVADQRHTLSLSLDPSLGEADHLLVRTDHPDQPTVRVSLVVLPSREPYEGGGR